jgi:imidazoleglycerol-phosphate dehydratase / histidinol-phosphatase
MKAVIFVDRDGTIIQEPDSEQVHSLDELEFVPGIIRGLHLLVEMGFTLVMVTNQDGLGTPANPHDVFDRIQGKILQLLKGEGIIFEEICICPHTPAEQCSCRKPNPGILGDYLEREIIDLNRSFVLGDRETDVELAHNLDIQSVRLVGTSKFGDSILKVENESKAHYITSDAYDACQHIAQSRRKAQMNRKTGETDIHIELTLDGSGNYKINTGLRFFDHMLEQIARHARIDMDLFCHGDLDVDEHHTVEDVGIALGEALREALGDKRGIERFGFEAPIDESLAKVSIDLSGRSYLVFSCEFQRERVGDLPTELVYDFFRALSDGLKATLHISCVGRNDHHKMEAIFKTVARALKQAIAVDKYALQVLPSTKGVL